MVVPDSLKTNNQAVYRSATLFLGHNAMLGRHYIPVSEHDPNPDRVECPPILVISSNNSQHDGQSISQGCCDMRVLSSATPLSAPFVRAWTIKGGPG